MWDLGTGQSTAPFLLGGCLSPMGRSHGAQLDLTNSARLKWCMYLHSTKTSNRPWVWIPQWSWFVCLLLRSCSYVIWAEPHIYSYYFYVRVAQPSAQITVYQINSYFWTNFMLWSISLSALGNIGLWSLANHGWSFCVSRWRWQTASSDNMFRHWHYRNNLPQFY